MILLFQSPDVFFLYFHESEEFVAVNRSDSHHHSHHHHPHHLPHHLPPHHHHLPRHSHHYCHIWKIFSDWFPVGWRVSGTQFLIWETPPSKRNSYPARRSRFLDVLMSRWIAVWKDGWIDETIKWMKRWVPALSEELISSPEVAAKLCLFCRPWNMRMGWCPLDIVQRSLH